MRCSKDELRKRMSVQQLSVHHAGVPHSRVDHAKKRRRYTCCRRSFAGMQPKLGGKTGSRVPAGNAVELATLSRLRGVHRLEQTPMRATMPPASAATRTNFVHPVVGAAAWRRRAMYPVAARRLRQAQECLPRAIALDPGYAAHHIDLGIVLQRMGQVEATCEAYRSALAPEPNNAPAAGRRRSTPACTRLPSAGWRR